MSFVHPGFSNPSRLQFHLHRSHHMSLLCCMQLSSPPRLLSQDLLPQLNPEVIPACHCARYIQYIVSISSPVSHFTNSRALHAYHFTRQSFQTTDSVQAASDVWGRARTKDEIEGGQGDGRKGEKIRRTFGAPRWTWCCGCGVVVGV